MAPVNFAFFLVLGSALAYEVPAPLIQALSPRGLRISIPDEPGMQLFAVHANINKPLKNLEAGQISVDITKPTNGRWVYEDERTNLKPNDVIHYWLYVQADGLGFRKDDQTFKVKELVPANGGLPVTPVTPVTTPPVTNPVTEQPPKCEPGTTIKNGKKTCKGKLIFEDNFGKFNPSKWQNTIQIANSPDYQFVLYSDKKENIVVKGNNLLIKPTLLSPKDDNYIYEGKIDVPSCTGTPNSEDCFKQAGSWSILPPISSAKIHTKLSFSFMYGIVEVRAKLPQGDWIFPEIWLEPKDNFYGLDNYQSGIIQLASARGNTVLAKDGAEVGNKHLRTGCRIGWSGIVHDELKAKDSSTGWSSDYHIYKLEWQPDFLRFSVDDQEIGIIQPPLGFRNLPSFSTTQNIPWSTKLAPFDKEFYLSLGVGVGGNYEFPNDCVSGSYPKPWKNEEVKMMLKFWESKDKWYPTWKGENTTLKVDYVKVFAV